jgi:polyisoprenoid-binding protein YceI
MALMTAALGRMILSACALLAIAAAAHAQVRPLDTERSSITIFVYKGGLFSAFADDHVIKAPLASGSISEEPPLSVEVSIRAAALAVLDPDLAPDKRAEVQARMLGRDVLDAGSFPDIGFTSTLVEPTKENQWKVTGRLTIHGRDRIIAFPVTREGGVYRGDVLVGQKDFGIEPIRIAGGTVRVKNELKIQFEIFPTAGSTPAR